MTKPKELDVPHWAARRVQEVRAMWNLPPQITDRMIYARLLEVPAGMQLHDAIMALLEEVSE